jgi:calreticulin
VDKSQAKPEDWNVEEDGEWEPPMIENPEYKGEWTQRTMKNPNYKGVWKPAQVSNPDYVPDEELYKYSDIGAVSIEIWQVKSGTIFDNILVGDDMVEAEKYAESTFYPLAEKEKQLRDEHFEASKPPETFRDEPEGEGDDEDGDEEPEGDSSSEKDEL